MKGEYEKVLNKIRLVGLLLGCLISISCNNAFRETFGKKTIHRTIKF